MTGSAKLTRATRPSHRCAECGYLAPKWVGRCPECQAWGSLTETGVVRPPSGAPAPGPVSAPARPIAQIDADQVRPRACGLGELDRVLGGGLIPGAVVLLAGEPGVGKSTLLLSAAASWTAAGRGRALIITGEESAAQVRLRASRMGALHDDLFLAAETDLAAALTHIDTVAPSLLVIDSVQTISTSAVEGGAGGVSQVRAVAAALTAACKQRSIACVLVGHVTKDGSIAGPRVLEHLVDVVLHFEGDRHTSLRMVRGVKNRYGPADEVGCFQMVDDGIVGLTDPSGLFLSGRRAAIPGTCATVALQGRRALPVELQALAAPPAGDTARRTFSGLDPARAAIVLAVLQRWGGLNLAGRELLAATVGGARMLEPAADLPLALAVWSSVRDIPLATGLVAIGELGLSADVRPVAGVPKRLAEAARLGFDHAIVPVGADPGRPRGMRVDQVSDLGEAFRAFGNDGGVVRWLDSRRR